MASRTAHTAVIRTYRARIRRSSQYYKLSKDDRATPDAANAIDAYREAPTISYLHEIPHVLRSERDFLLFNTHTKECE